MNDAPKNSNGHSIKGLLLTVGVIVFIQTASAVVDTSPYAAIAGRNSFALKPPTPPAAVVTPTSPPPGIELQGISTILGRSQVLLKIKVPPRPPEPAKDKSVVLDVGQREGDVEVLSIDNVAGVVSLKNQGSLLTLNMKDNAAKPVAGPALPPPSLPLPPPGNIPAPASGAGTAAPNGGGISLPTRSLRSDSSVNTAAPFAGSGTTQQTQTPEAIAQRTEANVALYEVNRLKNEELIKAGAKIPRMPAHSLLRSASQTDQ